MPSSPYENKPYFVFSYDHRLDKISVLESLIVATCKIDNQPRDKNFQNTLEQAWFQTVENYPTVQKYKIGTFNVFKFGWDMGLWVDNYKLSDLAQQVANQRITLTNYCDIVILNYINAVSNKTYNPLILTLEFCIKNDRKIINTKLLKKIFSVTQRQQNLDYSCRHFMTLLKTTSYFREISRLELELMVEPQQLLQKCNWKYHDQPLAKIQADIDNNNKKSLYLTTGQSEDNYELNLTRPSQSLNSRTSWSAHQKIYFGAPGTGKSFWLNDQAQQDFSNRHDRVTFHANFLYANLIGTYKPVPTAPTNLNQTPQITYRYVPGALVKMLIKALQAPEHNFLLIIEEINRADAAAVFGDFFQLLDRDDTGSSTYPIGTSEELRSYFEEVFADKSLLNEVQLQAIQKHLNPDYTKVSLPANLYIWATMNSADQSVKPLDTAFKRRWEFEYFDVNTNENEITGRFWFTIGDDLINWNDFRKTINDFLSLDKFSVPEDKLMGVYFISKTTLEKLEDYPDELAQVIQSKVLMYLYDDVVKHHRRHFFAPDQAPTFAKLCQNFQQYGCGVFASELQKNLLDKIGDKESSKTNIDE